MQHGWPRRFPIAQPPNAPLVVGAAAWVASQVTNGDVERTASAVYFLAMGVFAYLELTQGVNWFRRLLGAGVLVFLVIQLLKEQS